MDYCQYCGKEKKKAELITEAVNVVNSKYVRVTENVVLCEKCFRKLVYTRNAADVNFFKEIVRRSRKFKRVRKANGKRLFTLDDYEKQILKAIGEADEI